MWIVTKISRSVIRPSASRSHPIREPGEVVRSFRTGDRSRNAKTLARAAESCAGE
jgi:hypothetical protein